MFYFIIRFKDYLRLREAIKLADLSHKDTRDRYYVLPNGQHSGKLIVLNRAEFRLLKKKHYIPEKTRMIDVARECFYYTKGRRPNETINKETLDKKSREYFLWMEECRKWNRFQEKLKKKVKISLQKKEPGKPG